MHYINKSGKVIKISCDGTKEYTIQPWASITLPDQMHRVIVLRNIPLSVNYDKYLADLNNQIISIDDFLEICFMEQYYG